MWTIEQLNEFLFDMQHAATKAEFEKLDAERIIKLISAIPAGVRGIIEEFAPIDLNKQGEIVERASAIFDAVTRA
eukprot:6256148-Karenia_brevis.AAC.1